MVYGSSFWLWWGRFAIVSGVTATTQHQVSKLQAEEAQLSGHVTKLEVSCSHSLRHAVIEVARLF